MIDQAFSNHLYKMLLKHNIIGDTNRDANVLKIKDTRFFFFFKLWILRRRVGDAATSVINTSIADITKLYIYMSDSSNYIHIWQLNLSCGGTC